MKEPVKISLTLVAFLILSFAVTIFGLLPFFIVLVSGCFVLMVGFLFSFSIYFLVVRTASWVWDTLKTIWREYILMQPPEVVDNP